MDRKYFRPTKPQRSFLEWCKDKRLDLLVTLGGMVAVLLATIYLHFFAPASWTKNQIGRCHLLTTCHTTCPR